MNYISFCLFLFTIYLKIISVSSLTKSYNLTLHLHIFILQFELFFLLISKNRAQNGNLTHPRELITPFSLILTHERKKNTLHKCKNS